MKNEVIELMLSNNKEDVDMGVEIFKNLSPYIKKSIIRELLKVEFEGKKRRWIFKWVETNEGFHRFFKDHGYQSIYKLN